MTHSLAERVTAAWEGFRDGPADAPQRLDGYPEPYPRGWYRVASSREVRTGTVITLSAFEREFVAFRSEDGVAHVLDAHCPHLGAHLGDGRVEGDCLRCPFHHWTFRGDGALDAVPGLDRAPRARLGAWPVREQHGIVWIWFDPEQPHAEPAYEPQSIPDIDEGRLTFRGRRTWGEVRMHLVEFAENSVDFQHFGPLHGEMRLPWTRWRIPGVHIHHEADWEIDPERPWVATFSDDAHLVVLGRAYERTGARARITLWGPGGFVTFRFTLPDLGDIVLYQTHTPTSPMTQHVTFRWYADRAVPSLLAWYVVGNWVSQWREDLRIWSRKRYLQRPILCRLDGPVHPMRRWWRGL